VFSSFGFIRLPEQCLGHLSDLGRDHSDDHVDQKSGPRRIEV
jgi:hypothetical protein